MMAAALDYAARGFPVIPLHHPVGSGCSCGDPECESSRGKHPQIATGKDHRNATTDEQQIRQLWGQSPSANIGIPTGKRTSLVVLDIDPRHGGDESLAKLEDENGPLPRTVEAITGSGGGHP